MSFLSRLPGGSAAIILLGTCAPLPMAQPLAASQAAPVAAPRVADAAPGARSLPPTQADRFVFDGPMIQGGTVLGNAPTGTTFLTFDGQAVPIAADGRFLIAFDRDAGPTAELVARRSNGTEVRAPLTVAPRAWQIERLNTLPRISQPSEEFQRRRGPELAQIVAARKVESGSQGWRQTFLWPVTGRISGLFGSQRIYKGEPGSYHSGVDIARPTGTVVLAPADGVITLAASEEFTLEGKLLMMDHGMGLNSAFLHLSRIDVKVGETVQRGQPIGAVGSSGRATGPHLHWSMKWRDARIDPLLIAGPMPAAD